MASEQREEQQVQAEAGVEEITASIRDLMLKKDEEYVFVLCMNPCRYESWVEVGCTGCFVNGNPKHGGGGVFLFFRLMRLNMLSGLHRLKNTYYVEALGRNVSWRGN